LKRETNIARKLGFSGKFVIHPSQIDVVNRIFRPTKEEVAYAKQVVTVFEEARAKGFASASLDGKMIDIPIAQRALKILLIDEAISSKEKQR
jgi:citrate lyase subunit beta/citryl-CoA lyase